MDILSIKMTENDSGADTIRGYLIALLTELWIQEEGFSGKRPFGNSGWQYEIYQTLIRAGAVKGKLDKYGDIVDFDEKTADALIIKAIQSLN